MAEGDKKQAVPDITIPIDKDGLVIYFSVNNKTFFFNGHTGFLSDTLPDYAEDVFSALSEPKKQQVKTLKALKRKYGSVCEHLIREIRLFQDRTHPDLSEEPRQERFYQKMSPSVFNVYLSQSCNLTCRYCFNQQGSFGDTPSIMSVKTAKDVLSFISKIADSQKHPVISVNMFGGEPMLAPKALYILARGLQDFNHKNFKTKIHLTLSTNGTIYNKKIFDIFAERPDLSTVVFSLDAFKDIHDKNRPFVNPQNGSCYDRVLQNLNKAIQNKIPYSVTCVVPFPYDFVAASKKLHSLGVNRLEIKQLIHHIYGKQDLPEVFQNEFDTWRKNYIDYSTFYIDYLKEKNPAKHVSRFTMLSDYAKSLGNHGQPHRTLACGICDIKIGIAANGKLVPCESLIGHKGFEIGDAKTGFDHAKYEKFEAWILSKGNHRIDNKRCSKCFAKRICGGGCYALSFDKTGKLLPISTSSCEYIKETVKIDLYYLSLINKYHPHIFSYLNNTQVDETSECRK